MNQTYATTNMPLVRHQSEKSRKRQQRQEFLAQQDPEPKFDLSDCELQEVPPGVYAVCKVLQKEVLFLQCNWLKSLNGGGKLSDLGSLRVLDLHNNDLQILPDDICHLERLQILNLANNRLENLPENIGNLRNLQTLNVKGNKLKLLPKGLCSLPVLRMLDISDNEITMLPQQIAHLHTLETLLLDGIKFQYPPSDICKNGVEAIMKFLCAENGLQYQPPAAFLLAVMEPPLKISSSLSDNSIKTLQEEMRLKESIEQYQQVMLKKRMEAQALEKQLELEQHLNKQLTAAATTNKKHLLSIITQDQIRIDQELSAISNKKEHERRKFLEVFNNVEKQAGDLLSSLLDMNDKAKKTEALLEKLQRKQLEEDSWYRVRLEEFQNLRRQEVLEGMNQILKEFKIQQQQRENELIDRKSHGKTLLEMEEVMKSDQVENLLFHKESGQKVLIDTLEQQEKLQEQAVEALQLARDAKHVHMQNQILLIERELAQLTFVELEKRSLKLERGINILAEKRIALTALLAQLLDERQKREQELKERLYEMEQQREDGQKDFWLVQYQRLLDSKPQALIDQESQLEIAVKKILIKAGAIDYVPMFSRHHITIETMMQLTDSDLKQMGIHELGLRKTILKVIEQQQAEDTELIQKNKNILPLPETYETPPSGQQNVTPSAPPLEGASDNPDLSSQLPSHSSITARGINSECVVCMDRMSEVIFLPCGHVCSCLVCTVPLRYCPMCRAAIAQSIKFTVQ